MLNHVMAGSNDIARSKAFYDAVLAVLGAGAPIENQAASGHRRLFYRHAGSTFCISKPIDDAPATPGNGHTIGFKCASPEQVQQFHDVAVAAGGGRSSSRPACAKARWARCIWRMCVIPMATSSARSIGRAERPRVLPAAPGPNACTDCP